MTASSDRAAELARGGDLVAPGQPDAPGHGVLGQVGVGELVDGVRLPVLPVLQELGRRAGVVDLVEVHAHRLLEAVAADQHGHDDEADDDEHVEPVEAPAALAGQRGAAVGARWTVARAGRRASRGRSVRGPSRSARSRWPRQVAVSRGRWQPRSVGWPRWSPGSCRAPPRSVEPAMSAGPPAMAGRRSRWQARPDAPLVEAVRAAAQRGSQLPGRPEAHGRLQQRRGGHQRRGSGTTRPGAGR